VNWSIASESPRRGSAVSDSCRAIPLSAEAASGAELDLDVRTQAAKHAKESAHAPHRAPLSCNFSLRKCSLTNVIDGTCSDSRVFGQHPMWGLIQ
jgi:hypothetical protein